MEPMESVKKINVLAISDSGKKTSLFRLAAVTTIPELKRLWEAEHELPEGSVVRKTDGSRLEDGYQISEIEEVSPGSKTVTVLIEKCGVEGAAAAVEGEAKAGGRRERIGEESQDATFYVMNFCDDFDNMSSFSIVLRLPGRPTVADVRRAIAHHMRRPAATTELRRRVGRLKSGEEVFQVGRGHPLVYADVNGRQKDRRLVKEEDKILHDDEQPFPVVAAHRNCITVSPTDFLPTPPATPHS